MHTCAESGCMHKHYILPKINMISPKFPNEDEEPCSTWGKSVDMI